MARLPALQREHGWCLDTKELGPENAIPVGPAKRACRCSGVCRICLCAEKETKSNE